MESFPRDVEGAEDSIFPFWMEKKERERDGSVPTFLEAPLHQ